MTCEQSSRGPRCSSGRSASARPGGRPAASTWGTRWPRTWPARAPAAFSLSGSSGASRKSWAGSLRWNARASPALEPVLRARLEHETRTGSLHGGEVVEPASVRPDAVIKSLDELESVRWLRASPPCHYAARSSAAPIPGMHRCHETNRRGSSSRCLHRGGVGLVSWAADTGPRPGGSREADRRREAGLALTRQGQYAQAITELSRRPSLRPGTRAPRLPRRAPRPDGRQRRSHWRPHALARDQPGTDGPFRAEAKPTPARAQYDLAYQRPGPGHRDGRREQLGLPRRLHAYRPPETASGPSTT